MGASFVPAAAEDENFEPMDPEIVAAFLDESEESLGGVDEHLVTLEANPDDRERVDAIFRAFHSIKGSAAFFGLLKVKRLAHRLEDLLALVRAERLTVNQAVVDLLLEGVDALKRMLARVRSGEPECPTGAEAAFERLLSRVEALCAAPSRKKSEPPPAEGPEASAPRGTPEPKPEESTAESAAVDAANRTMRVEERKIDEFLDYVGELIIVREMFANVGKRLRGDSGLNHLSAEVQRALEAFTALSHDLQHSIMEVRKIPVRALVHKVPRVVRDLARATGKNAQVEVFGENIAVDKSLVEGLESPLLHMARNALDHGIETPEERERAGKPPRGTIRVIIEERPDEIVLRVEDDGRGIDPDALRRKAAAMGLITEAAAHKLTEAQAYDLLFLPGLSTAKTVTDVSGRGVGMDVVKRNVLELGGRIAIESRPGAGSTFWVHLPKAVTVQIFDGFLVRVGNERFVLPLQHIQESFRPSAEELHTVAERGAYVSRRGRIFPLVRFADVLALPGERPKPLEAIIVSIVGPGGKVAGLLVDDVLGTQQVVLRELFGLDGQNELFSGGAVLGDGRVAMVVDMERLGQVAL